MRFDTSRLERLRVTFEKARAVAIAKADQHTAAGEKQLAAIQLKRVVQLEEFSATVCDAMTEIESARHPKGKPGFTDGPGTKLVPTTPQARRIAAIMHRKLTTPWTSREVRAYKQLGIIPEDDLAVVEAHYAAHWPPNRDRNILRHDLLTFLNNFPGEVERARMKDAKPASTKKLAADPAGWSDFLASRELSHIEFRLAMSYLHSQFNQWKKGAKC